MKNAEVKRDEQKKSERDREKCYYRQIDSGKHIEKQEHND